MAPKSHPDKDFEILEEKLVYDGFFQVKNITLRHKLFDGSWSMPLKRELFDRLPVAAVLPYDPLIDKVVLIEQFRVGPLRSQHPWLLEIVAGISEEGESIEDLVRREAMEEAGLDILELIKAHEYWVSPGGSSEFISLYCGRVDASNAGGIHGLPDESEDIKVHVMSSQEAFQLLKEGKITNAATIIGLQWLELNLHKLFT